ncbi:UNVERIFIED_CONTAM: hypothetical protein Scaly_1268700 [Sesamum calycinum]|uniref:Uncharacterized protein n=1 Tax=Sesamum calycinum TaxID=2727403 RepID=A0AAW2Q679_9LAMI
MVREADHSGGVGVAVSSIALLQERFRQLQKMKELRQEKQLLRMMLSESERYSPPITLTPHDHQFRSNTFSGSESMMFLPPKPHCQLSLSLWPDSQTTKHPDSRGIVEVAQATRVNSSLVSTASSMKRENSGSDHDIDTSLHL